jgi:SAM-dependent methyltransferase
MCIAVLHHITSDKDRLGALEELLRVLKPGGKLLFQVWAREQELTSRFIPIQRDKNDFFVTWKNNDGKIIKRYYHLFLELELKILLSQLYNVKIISMTYEKDNWSIILERAYC